MEHNLYIVLKNITLLIMQIEIYIISYLTHLGQIITNFTIFNV